MKVKSDKDFPGVQFHINNYQFRSFRIDRNNEVGVKLVFIRVGLYKTDSTETICVELVLSKKKWCILFACRPPKLDKKFFQD